MDKCKHCKHWGGNKESNYGDCYMIIGELVPKIFSCYNDFGYKFRVPFDPHDVKYYLNSVQFKKIYSKLMRLESDKLIKKDIIIKEDLTFDSYGRRHIKRVKLMFLQIWKGCSCKHYEEGSYE